MSQLCWHLATTPTGCRLFKICQKYNSKKQTLYSRFLKLLVCLNQTPDMGRGGIMHYVAVQAGSCSAVHGEMG